MSMKLLILGLLMECNRHPYEIRQTIKARNWHHTFKLRDGSLYYAIDQMRQDSLIEAMEVIPATGTNRPDKTVYGITDKGKSVFLELLYDQMQLDYYPQHPMFMALPFARHADSLRLEEIIAEQLVACRTRIARIEGVLDLKSDWLPRGAVRMIQGILRLSVAERDWLIELLEDAKSGELIDPGRVPKPQ
ncbi:PadR family transcriptional regulator [Cohnella silvisoli]|uniref:PadR family transcriptional regulator n=1 Tax=Cohnella silvisoli TaxID=2873699 RepID=A0ABV1KXS3_9BACL|nr:PadR family transcriptional regulator [Cohnella silvisoli]MCD9024002.1 PadR family transcriptional regulator [Cohnella silvisoli]